jgi:pimeloyl-ACP methyl ester carboxylesterase
MKTKTIVLIHGMFMNNECWENWIPRYQAKGYKVLAPAWPGRDKSVEELRNIHPDASLPKLKLSDVVEHFARFIQGLDEKPAIVGHSMGGLVVQLLLQRDLAVAGVALDPAPPMGVFTTAFSFLKANLPAINPFLINQPALMTFEQFQYAFVNAQQPDEQRRAYERYLVPESRRVPTQSLGPVARVDFKKTHPPLLITAGERDQIIPASLNLSNYNRYKASPSVTDFKEFSHRDHFLIGGRGWEEVADYCLAWLEKIA